jgi:hypothetical protein
MAGGADGATDAAAAAEPAAVADGAGLAALLQAVASMTTMAPITRRLFGADPERFIAGLLLYEISVDLHL